MDEDGRPCGEIASVHFGGVATEMIACPHAGGRKGLPMNATALYQVTAVWPQVLAGCAALAGSQGTVHAAFRASVAATAASLCSRGTAQVDRYRGPCRRCSAGSAGLAEGSGPGLCRFRNHDRRDVRRPVWRQSARRVANRPVISGPRLDRHGAGDTGFANGLPAGPRPPGGLGCFPPGEPWRVMVAQPCSALVAPAEEDARPAACPCQTTFPAGRGARLGGTDDRGGRPRARRRGRNFHSTGRSAQGGWGCFLPRTTLTLTVGVPEVQRRAARLRHGVSGAFAAEHVALVASNLKPRMPRRGIHTSQRLGQYRWFVERTFAWQARLRGSPAIAAKGKERRAQRCGRTEPPDLRRQFHLPQGFAAGVAGGGIRQGSGRLPITYTKERQLQ